jgi:hypothetical protein
MLRLFSTHIAAKEFDPTGDVLLQLQVLDDSQPHPLPDDLKLDAHILRTLNRITGHDNKLRQKGTLTPSSRAHNT